MAKKELAKKAAVVRATTKEDKKTALDVRMNIQHLKRNIISTILQMVKHIKLT